MQWLSATPGGAAITNSVKTKEVTARHAKKKEFLNRSYRKMLQQEKRKKERRQRSTLIHQKTEAMRAQLESVTNARDILLVQLADQIFSRGHEYHSAATHVSYVPDGNPATPEIALVGRSRVGKTSLLRSLLRENRAAGRGNSVTRRDAINFYSVGGGVFNIADTPGLGGTSIPWSTMLQSAVLIRNFARCRPNLKMIYYCMDINTLDGVYIQDLDLLKFLSAEVPNFTIVLTKADKLPDKGDTRFTVEDVRKELRRNDIEHPMLVTSAFTMGGIDTLRFDMASHVLHSLPSEKLSLTEARKLSDRLISQDQLATVRPLAIPPTDLDHEVMQWNKAVQSEHATQLQSEAAAETAQLSAATHNSAMTTIHSTPDEVATAQQHAESYKQLLKRISNDGLMQYVHETSPWRNPLLWPRNIVPTKHPRKNIMRCPQDPNNPYLTQAHFVAPRADMYFRRPNVGYRKAGFKGKYESDDPNLLRQNSRFTIPFFPDIVDVKMFPMPWMFLGSKEAYMERPGGRMLGIRLARSVTENLIDPLSDNPAPNDLALTQELRRLVGGTTTKDLPAAQLPESCGEVAGPQTENVLPLQPPSTSGSTNTWMEGQHPPNTPSVVSHDGAAHKVVARTTTTTSSPHHESSSPPQSPPRSSRIRNLRPID